MNRFAHGIELTKTGGRILLADKRLLLYTLLSALCTIVAAAVILLPAIRAVQSSSQPYVGQTDTGLPIVRLCTLYFATSFIALCFNTALVAVVPEHLHGGDLSFEHGLWVAFDNILTIAVLAAISATLGVFLRTAARQLRIGAAIALALFDADWSVAIFLAVPVTVAAGSDPFSVIGRSIGLVRKTWGEDVSSSAGIGLLWALCALPAIVIGARGLLSPDHGTRLTCIAIAAVYLALLSLITSTLEQIGRAAIYFYAQTGAAPSGFDRTTMRGALSND